MTVYELRIGNWVQRLDKSVRKIDPWDFTLLTKGGIHPEPIPLTEDWLVKFGFDRHHSDFYNKIIMIKPDGEVKIFPSNLGSAISIGLFIKHVHTLQNLYFALTGEELTVKK